MKMLNLILVLIALFVFTLNGLSQITHNVSVANFSFTPAQLTIKVGDKVKWTNNGGLHNVVADDNSFTSGDPSTAAWIYEHTFKNPGSNPYYCVIHGGPGGNGMSGVINVENTTDVNDDESNIYNFELQQNYPNPFNPSTIIKFSISQFSKVNLKVFNILGDEISELVNDFRPKGNYEIQFDASNISSGIYFYTLQSGIFFETKKMIFLK